MSNRLVVIDQATATELAEVGGVTVMRAKPCRDCRHVSISSRTSPDLDRCLARSGKWCEFVNGDSRCELWEQAPVVTPPTSPLAVWTLFVAIVSFLLGAVIL